MRQIAVQPIAKTDPLWKICQLAKYRPVNALVIAVAAAPTVALYLRFERCQKSRHLRCRWRPPGLLGAIRLVATVRAPVGDGVVRMTWDRLLGNECDEVINVTFATVSLSLASSSVRIKHSYIARLSLQRTTKFAVVTGFRSDQVV